MFRRNSINSCTRYSVAFGNLATAPTRKLCRQRPRLYRGHMVGYMGRVYGRVYKGSAPRAADAARYARARQGRTQLKTCKGGKKKRPTIWCEQRFDKCQELLVQSKLPCCAQLCCVCFCYRCYVLIGSTGGTLRGGKNRGPRKIKYM